MNSRAHRQQFLMAGSLSALFLAAISVFAFRGDVPKEAALLACLLDSFLQILFGLACFWALRTSGILGNAPEFIDHGSPSLKAIAAIAPWLVLLQILMGAALRYKLMGAISHVAGAMFVGAFLLYFATGVMAPAPAGHPARLAAVILLWVILVQVVFGIAAYVVRFGQGPSNGLPDTRLFSILHIITASLTLGATIVLCTLVRTCSRKQEVAGLPSTGPV
jgi:hypothetical protein